MRPVVALIKSLASAMSIGTRRLDRSRGPDHPDRRHLSARPWARSSTCRCGSGSRWWRPAPAAGSRRRSTRRSAGSCSPSRSCMHEVSVRTLVPVGIATVTATYMARLFFGPNPVVRDPEPGELVLPPRPTPVSILRSSALGIVMGVVVGRYSSSRCTDPRTSSRSAIEVQLLPAAHARHAGRGPHHVPRPMRFLGHYYVAGRRVRDDPGHPPGFVRPDPSSSSSCAALKLAGRPPLTLGSGASGGVFSPAPVHGRHAGGRPTGSGSTGVPVAGGRRRRRFARGRDGRAWSAARRGGDGRDRHDLRDDPRLRASSSRWPSR